MICPVYQSLFKLKAMVIGTVEWQIRKKVEVPVDGVWLLSAVQQKVVSKTPML